MNFTQTAHPSQAEGRRTSFFFRSPSRSWWFVLLTAFSAAFVAADAAVLIKYRHVMSSATAVGLLILAYQGAFGGVLRIFRAHEEIYELHQSGSMQQPPNGSYLDLLLNMTANALLDGAARTLIAMSALLWLIVLLLNGHS